MSIAPPRTPSDSRPTSANDRKPSASEMLIEARIAEAASALWWAEVTRWTLGLVIGVLAVGTGWLVLDQWIYSPGPLLRCGSLAAFLAVAAWYVTRRIYPLLNSRVLPDYAARSLERDLPELRQALTSYVTLKESTDAGGLGGRVVRSIGTATADRLKSYDALPAEATGTMRWWIATAAALAVMVGYAIASPKSSLQSAARLALPLASIDAPHRVKITDVVPGDTDAIAGRSIDVAADVTGILADESVSMRWWTDRSDGADGDADKNGGAKTLELDRDVDGGPYRFAAGWTLPTNARGVVMYEVVAGDASAGPFQVRVRDIPVVAVESVTQTPPQYTGKPSHTHSGGAITAIDGTDVLIQASVNRPISRAVIEFNPRSLGDTTRATAGATEMTIAPSGNELSAGFRLRGARGRSAAVELDSYRIQVWDQSDQANEDPIVYPIRVITDLPPDVAIMMPVTTPKDVPINAQQIIEIHASDPDFGLSEIRLEVRRGIDVVDQPIVWRPADGKSNVTGNQVAEYRFRPGPKDRGGLNLQIGDTVQIVAVATDNRIIPGDKTAEPNVVRTDPITLKIVASDDLPQPGDPEAEGMSSPDEEPAANPNGEPQSGESQSGESQSGESQSGESQSGESQSGESQSGESQSGSSQSGESKSGQSSADQSPADQSPADGTKPQEKQNGDGQPQPDDPSQPEGEPQSGGGGGAGGEEATKQQPGENQSGGDPGGGSGSGQNPSNGNTQSGDGSQPSGDGVRDGSIGDQAGQPSGAPAGQPSGAPAGEPGKSGGGQPDPSQPNQAQPQGQPQDPSQGPAQGQSESNQPIGGQPSGQKQPGQQQPGQQQPGQQQPGQQQQQPGQQQPGDSSGEPSGSGATPGDKARNGQGQPGGEPSAPSHDGEAFERIKEYLDQQKNGSPSSTGTGNEKRDGSNATEPTEGTSKSDAGKNAEPTEGTPPDNGTNGDGTKGDDTKGKGTQGQSAKGEGTAGEANPGEPSGNGNQATDVTDAATESSKAKPSDPKPSDPKPSDNKPADTKPSGKPSENGSPSGKSQPGEGTDMPPSKLPPKPSDNDKTEDSLPGTGNGQNGEGTGGDAITPPDPVDQKYAKEATDMVLDYLEQTRDQPDDKLLEKLNWTQDDLKRFEDRWKNVRDLDGAPTDAPEPTTNVDEALRSLGLRKPGSVPTAPSTDKADSLQNIRDSGNRTPPPKAYRDAFDAFRRSMNQSR